MFLIIGFTVKILEVELKLHSHKDDKVEFNSVEQLIFSG
jgi:hypothetical protein